METVQTPESQAEEYGPEPGARCALKGLEKEFAMLKSRVWKYIMEWIERCSNLSGSMGACHNRVELTFAGRLNRRRGHSAAIPATQRSVTVLIQICIACSIKKADFFFCTKI